MLGIFNFEYPFFNSKIMKKTIALFFILLTIAFINKAKGQFNFIGAGIVLATGGEYKYDGTLYYNKSFGINLRANYNLNKKLKIIPDFNIYLPNKETFVTGGESKVSVFVLNINAHYILNYKSRDSYRIYLLAGAHIGGWNIKDNRTLFVGSNTTLDLNEFKIVPGGNVGAGMQLKLADRIQFFAEVKYVIANTNQLVFNPGVLYEF